MVPLSKAINTFGGFAFENDFWCIADGHLDGMDELNSIDYYMTLKAYLNQNDFLYMPFKEAKLYMLDSRWKVVRYDNRSMTFQRRGKGNALVGTVTMPTNSEFIVKVSMMAPLLQQEPVYRYSKELRGGIGRYEINGRTKRFGKVLSGDI